MELLHRYTSDGCTGMCAARNGTSKVCVGMKLDSMFTVLLFLT